MRLMLELPCRGLWEFKTSLASCQGHAIILQNLMLLMLVKCSALYPTLPLVSICYVCNGNVPLVSSEMVPGWMPLTGLSRLCAALSSILGAQALQAPRHHSSLSFNITHYRPFKQKWLLLFFHTVKICSVLGL